MRNMMKSIWAVLLFLDAPDGEMWHRVRFAERLNLAPSHGGVLCKELIVFKSIATRQI